MINTDFDSKFQTLMKEMIGIAYEFVNQNNKEVDAIYVIGLIEKGYFYKNFYRINGHLVKSHKVNSVSEEQYDISNERAFKVLNSGNDLLKEIEDLFIKNNREVPTKLELVYLPKTGKFDSKYYYELNYTNHKSKTAQNVYEEWYEIIDKSETAL